ncbi:hypothetical protein [Sphingobium xanthum]|jgi:hypothetical protein|nr:hypothetical protein [Sphingobium xanthum]
MVISAKVLREPRTAPDFCGFSDDEKERPDAAGSIDREFHAMKMRL